jgi:hypothetical protein
LYEADHCWDHVQVYAADHAPCLLAAVVAHVTGEELTFDYNFERYGDKPMRCFCGSKKCRKFIGGTQESTANIVELGDAEDVTNDPEPVMVREEETDAMVQAMLDKEVGTTQRAWDNKLLNRWAAGVGACGCMFAEVMGRCRAQCSRHSKSLRFLHISSAQAMYGTACHMKLVSIVAAFIAGCTACHLCACVCSLVCALQAAAVVPAERHRLVLARGG